jgi:hypothetical protein
VAPTRDLRLLAGATFLSSAGDLLALIVLALQVHELTGSGLAVSALFATTLVPAVAVAPLAGLVADASRASACWLQPRSRRRVSPPRWHSAPTSP